MPGDEARGKDDELLGQIDELKARMDRLMKGGTSTSNSALLTDAPKQPSQQTVEPQPTPTPPPQRTRVRDLIGSEEREILEDLPADDDPVAFPDEVESADEKRPTDRPVSPPPPTKPKAAVVDGSLIAVDDKQAEPRPRVSSFDDLGSAIEEELAKDASVPPPSAKKGPDLASRFGPVEEAVAPDPVPAPAPAVEVELVEEPSEAVVAVEAAEDDEVPTVRSHVGAVVAIWVFTAVTSGTIATLHFTGII